MNGFSRALKSEGYLLAHRRSTRWAVALVACATFGRIFVSYVLFHINQNAGGGGPEDHAEWNFWPQFAFGARAGMFLAELFLLGLLASALPREISSGAVRDSFTRGISRNSFIFARLLSGLYLAFFLWLVAGLSSWIFAHAFFEPSAIMEGGDEYLTEGDVLGPIYLSVLHALPPLLALSSLAVLLSSFCRRSVLAAGVGLICILLPSVFHDSLGDFAPWIFVDTLGGFGENSFLVESSGFASAIAQAYPADFDQIVEIGWIAPWPALVLFGFLSLVMFRKRPL